MDELLTFVSVDIANDKVRREAVRVLKDYGLTREHYSVFRGMMTRNRREELYVRLRIRLREQFDDQEDFGRITIIPVAEREASAILRFAVGTPGARRFVDPPEPASPDPSRVAAGEGES